MQRRASQMSRHPGWEPEMAMTCFRRSAQAASSTWNASRWLCGYTKFARAPSRMLRDRQKQKLFDEVALSAHASL